MIICVIGILGTQDAKVVKTSVNERTSLRNMLINKKFFFYLIIACLFYGITNVNSLYLLAMYQENGLTVSQATTVIFAGTMMELPIILTSRYYMNRISNKVLLIIVFVLLSLQLFTYSILSNVMIKIIMTFLTKSVCTMAFIMINMKVIATIIDANYQMSALAIVSMFKSFISIVFQTISGKLIDFYSYQVFYSFLFVCALIGLVCCIFYKIPSGNEYHLFD